MATTPAAANTPSPFVFPGSAAKNRERNVSFDSSGGSMTGKRGMSDDTEALDGLENPLLRRPHAPLAVVQTNHARMGLASPTGSRGASGTPSPRSILRHRKPHRTSHVLQSNQENSMQPARIDTVVPPPKHSISTDFAGSFSTSMPFAHSKKNLDEPSAESMTSAMAPYSYDNLPSSRTAAGETRTSSTWILVYGFRTQQQLQEIIQRFGRMGEILNRAVADGGDLDSSSLRGNWVALQYTTILQTEKALAHAHECLSDGVTYCGVKSLDPDDPILLNHSQRHSGSLFGGDGMHTSWNTTRTVDPRDKAAELLEDDTGILERSPIEQNVDGDHPRGGQRSLCDRVCRYLLNMSN